MTRPASRFTTPCLTTVLFIFKTARAVLFSAVVVSAAARAQGQEAKATEKDSAAVIFGTYERLFTGVALSEVRRGRAIDVIRKAFHETVRPHSAAADSWPHAKLALQRRDSTLRSLLTTKREREAFDKNAARARAHWR